MQQCSHVLLFFLSETSLREGLFHDYKKHGKVMAVRLLGSGNDRFAVVCFKKPEDAEKALDASREKLFFGVKIQVSATAFSSPPWTTTWHCVWPSPPPRHQRVGLVLPWP